MDTTILCFASGADLGNGRMELNYKVCGKVEDIVKILLNIDFEPFESANNLFIEPYTLCGKYGWDWILELDNNVEGFDLLVEFNDDTIYSDTKRCMKYLADLADYVLKYIKGKYEVYEVYDALCKEGE